MIINWLPKGDSNCSGHQGRDYLWWFACKGCRLTSNLENIHSVLATPAGFFYEQLSPYLAPYFDLKIKQKRASLLFVAIVIHTEQLWRFQQSFTFHELSLRWGPSSKTTSSCSFTIRIMKSMTLLAIHTTWGHKLLVGSGIGSSTCAVHRIIESLLQ
jgi:hypothetical protein